MVESFKWGQSNEKFEWGKNRKNPDNVEENLSLNEEIAGAFILGKGIHIESNKTEIKKIKEMMQGLDPVDILSQHFQEILNKLSADNKEIIADCEKAKSDPSKETIHQLMNKYQI